MKWGQTKIYCFRSNFTLVPINTAYSECKALRNSEISVHIIDCDCNTKDMSVVMGDGHY